MDLAQTLPVDLSKRRRLAQRFEENLKHMGENQNGGDLRRQCQRWVHHVVIRAR
ncbi:hypothetical protein HanXRQr2_Chr07g0294751 [Helianthus annuus]|uniref:Uncharacterized protein n=1 Tax=Helianthus annuus TaxID=4232 RepID=A0A9K3ILJ3_HELAN|nr:hypothetical protein HanXRQr2_Chr07g0294751 [Helianthus annuus]KAJ0904703.1 hypothetical protein HanPSC8_Chr07g0285341 [Helianthus annuus]